MQPDRTAPTVTLDPSSADPDPIRQFTAWLGDAVAAEIPNAEAMALATVGADGRPSTRFVLLKGVGRRGFVFYTNLESRKAGELDGNPRAALALYWVSLGRQVRIEGTVEQASRVEVERYFATRPRGSRVAAWASPQSRPIESRAHLERRVAEIEARYPGDDVPTPPFWGGYRVVPETIEFWEHRDSRLHDRLRYARRPDGWAVERLAP